jgi:hypothetical protein
VAHRHGILLALQEKTTSSGERSLDVKRVEKIKHEKIPPTIYTHYLRITIDGVYTKCGVINA